MFTIIYNSGFFFKIISPETIGLHLFAFTLLQGLKVDILVSNQDIQV